MITSAPTNSQLAGVLAGFVFTGIIILFGRSGMANTRTLGLFCSAFVVLAFDSYLFSLISGGSHDPLCQRIWTETMAASGMLAVGGTALISGIAWLLANYAQAEKLADREETGSRPGIGMQKLSQLMVLGVAAGVTLLLGMTTLDYIYVIIGGRAPGLLVVSAYLLPLIVVALAAFLGVRRTARNKHQSNVRYEASLPARSLTVAIYCTLGYGIVGPLFAGGVTNIGDDVFMDTSWPLVGAAVLIGFLIPVALVVLLVYAVPRVDAAQQIKNELLRNIDEGCQDDGNSKLEENSP